jgi:hypothetical protein
MIKKKIGKGTTRNFQALQFTTSRLSGVLSDHLVVTKRRRRLPVGEDGVAA